MFNHYFSAIRGFSVALTVSLGAIVDIFSLIAVFFYEIVVLGTAIAGYEDAIDGFVLS